MSTSPSSPRRASVVIPTWNGSRRVEDCVASLTATPADRLLDEILVVDNGSRDEEQETLLALERDVGRVRILRLPENRGFAAACNFGLEHVRSEFAAVLNDDTRVAPRALEILLRAHSVHPRLAFTAPRSNYVKGRQLLDLETTLETVDPTELGTIETALARRSGGKIEDVEHLAGLCLVGRTDVWRELDGFDERYGIGNYEDDDLCRRAREIGLRLAIAHDAYVWHEGNATFAALGIDYREQIRDQRAIFESRWHDDPLALAELASLDEDHERVLSFEDDLDRLSGTDRLWACAVLARAYDARGNRSRVEELWAGVLRVAPMHVEAACGRTLALLALGRDDEAEAVLNWISSELPLDSVGLASLHTQRARIYFERGDRANAECELENASEAVRDFVPAVNLRAVLAIETQDYPTARALLEPHAQAADADLLANLGIARFHTGDVPRAIEAFEAGKRHGGEDCTAAHNLRTVLAAQRT